jgi:hypothetical protein
VESSFLLIPTPLSWTVLAWWDIAAPFLTGFQDPILISHVKQSLNMVEAFVRSRSQHDYELKFHQYGKITVMARLEPNLSDPKEMCYLRRSPGIDTRASNESSGFGSLGLCSWSLSTPGWQQLVTWPCHSHPLTFPWETCPSSAFTTSSKI